MRRATSVLRRPTTYYSALGLVALVATLIPLLRYGYIGKFVRYMADDYCTSAVLQARGFWGTQVYWYQGWTGRFTFTGVISIAEKFGMGTTRVVPILLLVLFVLVAVWAVCQLHTKAQARSVVRLIWASVLGTSLTLAIFALTPNLIQSFYWETGGLTYFAPILIFLVTAGLIVRTPRARHLRANLVVVGLLAFINAGFSESYSLMQVTIFAYALIVCLVLYRSRRNPYLRPLISALVGAVVGLIVVILAPGNKLRLAYFPPHQDAVTITVASFQSVITLCQHFLTHSTTIIPLLIVVGAATLLAPLPSAHNPKLNEPKLALQLLLAPFATIGLMMACYWPVYYGYTTHTTFPDRTIILAVFALILGALYIGYLLGLISTKAKLSQVWVIAVLGVAVVVMSIWNSGQQTNISKGAELQLRTYAYDWGLLKPIFEHPSKPNLIVTNLPGIGGIVDLSRDPNNWFNGCVSQYYHLKSVEVR